MLFQTTRGQEALRAQIRQFAEEEIRPQAFLMDQNNEFPEEAIRKLGERGWMGLPYPAEYGGAGLDVMSYAIAVEELARVDGGAGVILSAHVSHLDPGRSLRSEQKNRNVNISCRWQKEKKSAHSD